MKKHLFVFATTLVLSSVLAKKCFSQTETYYGDLGCKVLYLEATSSKVKIFYGNGMEEEVAGKPELSIVTISNLLLKNGYQLISVTNKSINGEQQPGYLFFVRKEE